VSGTGGASIRREVSIEGLSRLAKTVVIAIPIGAGIVGIVIFLAGLPFEVATLSAALIAATLFVAFLWYVRDGLIVRATTARSEASAATRENAVLQDSVAHLRGVEAERRELQTKLDAKNGQLVERDARISSLEAERARLSEETAQLRVEREALQATNDRLQGRITTVESSVALLTSEKGRLELALRDEQNNTARAPFQPSMDVSLHTTGFGVLAAKNVHIVIRNVGPGNALNVELSASSGHGPVQGAVTPRGFWPVLTRNETRDSVIGSLDEFAGDDWIRVVVAFNSQFGPCIPVGVSWPVPT
jgi:hypothetical protein